MILRWFKVEVISCSESFPMIGHMSNSGEKRESYYYFTKNWRNWRQKTQVRPHLSRTRFFPVLLSGGINRCPNYVNIVFFIIIHKLEREKAIEGVLECFFVIFLEYSSIPSAGSWFFSQFLGFHLKVLVCSFLLYYLIFYYCLILFLDW